MTGIPDIFPGYRILSWRSVVDSCVERFLNDYNGSFTARDDGTYVLSSPMAESTLETVLGNYAREEVLMRIPKRREKGVPDFAIFVGSCFPAENILLGSKDVPERIRNLVERFPDLRYFLTETGIELDMRMFNVVFDTLFSKWMKDPSSEGFGKNVVFVRHRRLDEWFMMRIVMSLYGALAERDDMDCEETCVYDVNSKIDEMCSGKDILLASNEVKAMKEEIRRYLDICIGEKGEF